MKFKNTQFPDETCSYIAPTWEEMGGVNLNLGMQILRSNHQFDILVTLAKGGWTWSRSMADILNISEIASFQLMAYDPVLPGKKLDKITLKFPLNAALKGKRTLLFDDVSDTGESLLFSMQYLKQFEPKSITTATLFHKPHSKFKPDFFGVETDAWIIFPHERREGIAGLTKKWLKKGLTLYEIRTRLLKIGLPKKEIDFFLKLEKL